MSERRKPQPTSERRTFRFPQMRRIVRNTALTMGTAGAVFAGLGLTHPDAARALPVPPPPGATGAAVPGHEASTHATPPAATHTGIRATDLPRKHTATDILNISRQRDPAPKPTALPTQEGVTRIVVKRGDSEWRIARQELRHEGNRRPTDAQVTTRMHVIDGLNLGIDNPNELKPGQKLTVPTTQLGQALTKLDNAHLPKQTPSEIKSIQRMLRNTNSYPAGTDMADRKVRTHDDRLAKEIKDVMINAQEPGSSVQKALQSAGIEVTTPTPSNPDHHHPTPYHAIAAAPHHGSSFRTELKTAIKAGVVQTATLGQEPTVWNANQSDIQTVTGKPATNPEISLSTQVDTGLNRRIFPYNDMQPNTKYETVNKSTTLLLAALSNVSQEQLHALQGKIPESVYKTLVDLHGLNNRPEGQTWDAIWRQNQHASIEVMKLCQKISPELFAKYKPLLEAALKDPKTAAKNLANFLTSPDVQAALAKTGAAPSVRPNQLPPHIRVPESDGKVPFAKSGTPEVPPSTSASPNRTPEASASASTKPPASTTASPSHKNEKGGGLPWTDIGLIGGGLLAAGATEEGIRRRLKRRARKSKEPLRAKLKRWRKKILRF